MRPPYYESSEGIATTRRGRRVVVVASGQDRLVGAPLVVGSRAPSGSSAGSSRPRPRRLGSSVSATASGSASSVAVSATASATSGSAARRARGSSRRGLGDGLGLGLGGGLGDGLGSAARLAVSATLRGSGSSASARRRLRRLRPRRSSRSRRRPPARSRRRPRLRPPPRRSPSRRPRLRSRLRRLRLGSSVAVSATASARGSVSASAAVAAAASSAYGLGGVVAASAPTPQPRRRRAARGPARTRRPACCRSRPRAPGPRQPSSSRAPGGDGARRADRHRRPAAGSGAGPGRRLLGLLEAEPQAMPLGVERDDLELERLALVDDVARVGDALVGQLADVDQALEPVADAHECAEVDELRDRAVDDVADLEVGHRRVPRVGLEAADRRLIRPRSWLMSMTSASTSSPTL